MLLYNILADAGQPAQPPRTRMQIKIRYLGGTLGAREELIRLVQLAGYAIQKNSSPSHRPRNGSSIDIDLILRDDLLPNRKRSSARKNEGVSVGERALSVMSLTDGRAAKVGKKLSLRTRATNLRGLREAAGKTQAEVARRTAMSQPQLSRLESRKDHLVSTLRKYVRALGGEIEVAALIGGRRIPLRDV